MLQVKHIYSQCTLYLKQFAKTKYLDENQINHCGLIKMCRSLTMLTSPSVSVKGNSNTGLENHIPNMLLQHEMCFEALSMS